MRRRWEEDEESWRRACTTSDLNIVRLPVTVPETFSVTSRVQSGETWCPHLYSSSTWYPATEVLCLWLSGEVRGRSAAASSLLLRHLLYLPLPPLQHLHPAGLVAGSLLSPHLIHILEKPVPVWEPQIGRHITSLYFKYCVSYILASSLRGPSSLERSMFE